MRVERKGGGKYGRASCCRIGWRRDEGERRAKGWAGRGRSEKRLLNAMEARLSKRGGKREALLCGGAVMGAYGERVFRKP